MALKSLTGDILWNFDILGSIDLHQTLLVDGDRLNFDNRYLQSVRRTISQDSRDHVLRVIQKTFDQCEELLHAYQCNVYCHQQRKELKQEQLDIVTTIHDNINHILSRKQRLIDGLTNLASYERYANDSAFKIEIQRFLDRVEKICKKCEAFPNIEK